MAQEEGHDARGPNHEVVASVLSFYSSELASHAAIITGFIVAIFAVIQVRNQLSEISPAIFELATIALTWGVLYSVFRVVLYGSLSSILLHVSVSSWRQIQREESVRELSDHAQVNYLAESLLKAARVRRLVLLPRGYSTVSSHKRVKSGLWFQVPFLLTLIMAAPLVSVGLKISSMSLSVIIVSVGWSACVAFDVLLYVSGKLKIRLARLT